MNLKGFHIFFLLCSTGVAVFLALWGFQGYRHSGDPTHLWLGVVAVVMILALLYYGGWFLREIRKLPKPVVATLASLALSQLISHSAWACAVCFKDPDAALVKGAQSGVLFLGIVVYVLLMGILVIAFTWYRRAKRLSL